MRRPGSVNVPADPKILRTIVRDADQNVGMYARALGEGRIAVGDSVEIDVA